MSADAQDADAIIFTIYEVESGLNVAPDEEQVVLAAMQLWVTSAKTRDTLLSLTLRTGGEYTVRASQITAAMKSTPESRLRGALLSKRDDDEQKEFRRDVGYVPGDDA